MADIKQFSPIGKRILVRKCTQGVRSDGCFMLGTIAIPEYAAENTGWAEILSISPDCELFTKDEIGCFVHLPPWKPNEMKRISKDGEDFVVKESLFEKSAKDGGADPYIYRG